ncbi:MAG TPA: ATP-binding protein [Sandaracinaceae bacterium LLY-WYZ-13_1]|nr:ATP-binding protein [Sandaracinaceae bacterium LLY-WYZ-13_1]
MVEADGTGSSTEDALGARAGMRRHGLGLRAQIMIALGVAFALAVVLLGMATARLGGRAVDADRRRAAEAEAELLAFAARLPEARRRAALEAAVGRAGVVGAALEGPTIEPVRRGRFEGARLEATHDGITATLWLESAERGASRALPGLLFLYVGITAAAILLLSYVLLTRLIVRPVEDLTRASERLARGRGEARVPIRGAAEVARLAVSFHAMQDQLAAERAALRSRLEELERTTAELSAAQRSLVRSEKMASVGRLAAGVAHEIGNPLTSILGLIELVEDGDLPADEQREFLGRVRRETERIHAIIRDLLDFARGEPAEGDADARCDLVEVVEDAVRLVGPQKDLRHVTLERRFAEEVPAVHGSASRLAQVVLNLLLNAADAIDGDGTIRLEVHPVDDRWVELSVTDTGPGIDEDVLEHLFEPFVTTKPTGQGTGLGLAVCHTLVEQLGGTLGATNPPEGGARFTVRLPIG